MEWISTSTITMATGSPKLTGYRQRLTSICIHNMAYKKQLFPLGRDVLAMFCVFPTNDLVPPGGPPTHVNPAILQTSLPLARGAFAQKSRQTRKTCPWNGVALRTYEPYRYLVLMVAV